MKTEEKSINYHAWPDTAENIPETCYCGLFSGSGEGAGSIRFPKHVFTEGDVEIWIRPVQPEDAALLKTLFESLSPQSIYFRFFSPLRQIPDRTLHRLTHTENDCDIVLVALDGSGKMLGICCVVIMEDGVGAEFAVLIGDPWQGKGVGAELLKHCLMLAKDRKVEQVWGRVLPENLKMLALGKKLGFTMKQARDAYEYELVIDLRKIG